jgi:hypothetical protein
MINIFIADYAEANGKIMQDITDDLEDAILIKQGVDEYGQNNYPGSDSNRREEIIDKDWKTHMDTYIDNLRAKRYRMVSKNDLSDHADALRGLLYDKGFQVSDVFRTKIIEVSKQGNRTRFQLLGAYGDRHSPDTTAFEYSLNFTDMRDFVRQVRGMSLSLNSNKAVTGYDLSIVQGVKYNYWKYAGENSSIPNINTYTKPYPEVPNFVVNGKTDNLSPNKLHLILRTASLSSTGMKFFVRVPIQYFAPTIYFYYSTENKFSKATPAQPRISKWYAWGNTNSEYEIYGLKPDTNYYIWATTCWGYLDWFQSKPVLTQIRTKPEGGRR